MEWGYFWGYLNGVTFMSALFTLQWNGVTFSAQKKTCFWYDVSVLGVF